jgi:DNA-directed RNA polymerase beta subunit
MIQSHHLYPLFPDLLTSQKKSVQSFWEKGVLEEFELFSYIIGKKKNLQMILHGSKFMLQKPKYTIEEAIRKQKSYSVSLFLPIELKWYSMNSSGESAPSSWGSGSTQALATEGGLLSHNSSKSLVPSPFLQFSHTFPVFLGDIPLMTERGNFFINGSARVLVNQIVRCPSVYFKVKIDHKNRRTYIASFLSDYGSWLRLETDYKSRIWVRIDKSQRVSIYALLRSLGFPESFLQYQLKYYSFLFASRETYYTENPNEAIQYLWKKLTPGRWNSIQGCYAFLYNKFFNPRRYSIGPVGRLRLNKRLNRKKDGNGKIELSQDPGQQNSFSGEIGSRKQRPTSPSLPTLTPEDVFLALDLLIQLHYGEGHLDDIDHLKNRRVRLPGELIQNQFRLALSRITQVAGEKITKFEVEKELYDRRASTKPHEINKTESKGYSSSRSSVSAVGHRHGGSSSKGSGSTVGHRYGDFFPAQSGVKTGKWASGTPEPTIRGFAMKSFFQAQLFGSSIRELFHTSQLSQYMDQTNPLAEITHKRRLSSLGPGGIGRDQAGFAVREIHPSHFGRICPIETPEGPNAGLVGSLASYCRITENGFLQSPYFSAKARKDDKRISESQFSLDRTTAWVKPSSQKSEVGPDKTQAHNKNKKSEWFLFSAEVEDESYMCSENGVKLFSDPPYGKEVSQPLGVSRNSQFDFQEKGAGNFSPKESLRGFVKEKLYPTRYKQEFLTVEKNQIQFFSVSPIQMISLATSLIPFLEHDDANRALMGSNMQRQAVPILFAEKPFVGTGLEIQAARDSSTTLLVKQTGQVTYVDAAQIIVESQSLATPGQSKNQDIFVLEDQVSGYSREKKK